MLAHILAAEPDPVESIAPDQSRAHAVRFIGTAAREGRYWRLVQLKCGHFKTTHALRRTDCPRCGAMRRAGYDYDAFRHLGQPDTFAWPGGPLRELHERPLSAVPM
ncbi:MAG TPA: hypothetical protein VFQ88_07240 [Nevskiaceae bacterium]|nr:hypothetical protein [Nevskiaceae bacterium]